MPYYTECDTNRQAVIPPSRPKFKFNVLHSESGRYARIKVTWQPQIEGNPGSHFYVQYKKEMDTQYKSSEEELNQDSVVVGGKKERKKFFFKCFKRFITLFSNFSCIFPNPNLNYNCPKL